MHRKVVAVLFCDMVGSTSLGESTEADALARVAVAITQRTDALNIQGDAFYELAQVLHAAGRRNEAAVTLGQALKRYARKNLAQAGQVRKRLARVPGRSVALGHARTVGAWPRGGRGGNRPLHVDPLRPAKRCRFDRDGAESWSANWIDPLPRLYQSLGQTSSWRSKGSTQQSRTRRATQ